MSAPVETPGRPSLPGAATGREAGRAPHPGQRKGRFVTFEGIDGAGKSSHIEALAAWLSLAVAAAAAAAGPGRGSSAAGAASVQLPGVGPVRRCVLEVCADAGKALGLQLPDADEWALAVEGRLLGAGS